MARDDRHGDGDVVDPDLSDFQQTILAVLAEERRYGLAIKRELEDYYQTEVNHGRLYPNLDDLVEAGYVEKSELDKRTNQYTLTADGLEAISSLNMWLLSKLGVPVDQADALELDADIDDDGRFRR